MNPQQSSMIDYAQPPLITEFRFFHHTPNDNNFYHVTCQIISASSDDHDYDHGFFYCESEINYYVKCKLYSHSLIVNILNRKMYGNDIGVNNLELKKSFSSEQRLNLEQSLKQVLPYYLMQSRIPKREMRVVSDRNMNPLRDRNAEQVVLMTDNQNHFGNQNQNRFYLNDAEGYTHPQKLINFSNTSMLPREDRNTNVNIRTNVMATSQTVLMSENQNNNNIGLHHQNSVGGYINNSVICSQQHVGLNNFSSHESDICNNRNTNLSHENNIQNDCLLHHQNRIDDIQQADLNNLSQRQIPGQETRTDYYTTTYTNLDYQYDSTRSAYSTYTQQQIDLVPMRENNNMETTQANPTIDINRNYDNNNGMPCNDNQDVSFDSST
ncbi:uncharacterized protein OCT59_010592 [Rhizophagus irregularis]|uniref:Uncharacterized protein n=3 Tax=Rhizophagus irregularis TaxID=588596 RepID=A0A015J6R5_RHIIW|nr:hypothetical protein GLOIN_2v1801900 [Rhizophagus irregularis DAOM 181602=DAOM 197198]EXX62485.1 hypothetical protein RirG_161300 [Rhizophagus irregularis DAOM 197198w]UZO19295.1 hypothetical protein OCT59_010592 [Rhizophagus irregularis]POG66727.1 hypothetical protein GLOIN_2v1801900 [Rhizophagus irregularis DAOM 181602=DAOM 197198]CAG8620144.1 5829_t:CDS:1 [Rhizophagus irregularis]GBC13290.1 hypothetical protein GLOIN_2v1801900 [Rhizophagus irregularis DAOM 181602=DAOM 197198]|eukprot:XP_025173593.1 hypothetical protein GLOIN_2v1801900 [Rhizophagus irregularis DAOM 181602=DAOM 197198]